MKKYIGLPYTPAKHSDIHTIDNVVDVLMSCGGGMGGAQWHEYIITDRPTNTFSADGLICVTTYLGKQIYINTKNIVMATPNKQITVDVVTSDCEHLKGNTYTRYFIHDVDDEIIINTKYYSSDSSEILECIYAENKKIND